MLQILGGNLPDFRGTFSRSSGNCKECSSQQVVDCFARWMPAYHSLSIFQVLAGHEMIFWKTLN